MRGRARRGSRLMRHLGVFIGAVAVCLLTAQSTVAATVVKVCEHGREQRGLGRVVVRLSDGD